MDKAALMRTAKYLAKCQVQAEPDIRSIWLFPADHEVRLVSVDPGTLPHGSTMLPFYFDAAPKDGIHFQSAVALIRPEEFRKIKLPDGWGRWNEAIPIFP